MSNHYKQTLATFALLLSALTPVAAQTANDQT
jgi:hypothetical protein